MKDELAFAVDRTIIIRARRATVFRYFTDSERFAAWWGSGSSIDPRPGGRVVIRYPGDVIASGEVVDLVPQERVVFTYGYEDPKKPIPPGGSRVTVTLEDHAGGTAVRLRHDVSDAAIRDAHVPGWWYQLSVFANVVAREAHAQAGALIDGWFRAFGERDLAARRSALEAVASPTVVFQDPYACISGRDELEAHIAALHKHVPGTISRVGEVRQCQGVALAAWEARSLSGEPRGRGHNVFELDPDGKIMRVVGLWEA